jgi:beta-mannosidase
MSPVDRWMPLAGRAAYTLTDGWAMCPVDTFRHGNYPDGSAEWLPTTVPSHWQQHPALQTHVGKVVYRCHFATPAPPTSERSPPTWTDRAWLRFNGIFYWWQSYLNGVDLGRHEGYFIPYEHEVTAALQHENALMVEVECPDEHRKFDKRMITGVFSHWDCMDPQANPGGIWLPVEVQYSGPVRLHSVRCHTETFNDQFAQLYYSARLDALSAGAVLLRWSIAPATFDGPVQTIEQRRTLQQGRQEISGLLKLYAPRLWWTHDLGTPDLYTITLEVLQDDMLSDRLSFDFGVRRFELRDWIPHLNGVRFMVKGNNYAPSDMRIATATSERCEGDMRLARACHMNLLRIHAHIDHPALYAAANRAGVLLWQDMPLQWLYRAEVLGEAQRQARAMVRLLYNHPSVAVWCMHNEPLYVGTTSVETLTARLQTYNSTFVFSWNRDVLDTQMKHAAEKEDPHRPVVRSSGEFSIPHLRSGTDVHMYFGWYVAYGPLSQTETLIKYFPLNTRFVTEFGAQSFPNLESCLKFMPADIQQIDFDYLAERHNFQPAVMSNWLPWREAASLQELIDMTQNYQGKINRFYIDRLRYQKYNPTGGIVPFMFCEASPGVLWSVVDYWRTPKRSYYALQMAFSPQYAFTLFSPRTYQVGEAINLPLYAINDAHYPVHSLLLTARLRSPEGTKLAFVEHVVALDADCTVQEIDCLRLTPRMEGIYTLEIALTGGTLSREEVPDAAPATEAGQHCNVHHVYELEVQR